MIIIYLIIFIISIDDITTENHATNHLILSTSCQITQEELERSKKRKTYDTNKKKNKPDLVNKTYFKFVQCLFFLHVNV